MNRWFLFIPAIAGLGLLTLNVDAADTKVSDAAGKTTSDAGSGIDANASADAGPPEHKLQDVDYVERLRAEHAAVVTSAEAEFAAARKALQDLEKIKDDYDRKKKQRDQILARNPDGGAATAEASRLDEDLSSLRKSAIDLSVKVDSADEAAPFTNALADLRKRYEAAEEKVASAKAEKSKLEDDIDKAQHHATSIGDRLAFARRGRCATAYCFGGVDGTRYAFEPMLELPIGATFAIGDNALTRFNNANEITIQFSAGLRFWFADDLVSFAIFFAKPIYTSDAKLRIPGSAFEHPTTSIRRLGPSFGFGFFGDMVFLGAGWDELTNATSSGLGDPNYAPNQVLARSLTINIGLAPFAAIRNGVAQIKGVK